TGSKQAAITVAEGQKQAAILTAEGDRQAAILRAEGFSLALSKIFDVARTVDANTMSLQYLDALKQIGASPSTKFVVPMELSTLLQGITGSASRWASFSPASRSGEAASAPGSGDGSTWAVYEPPRHRLWLDPHPQGLTTVRRRGGRRRRGRRSR
ncbi:MAG TPA: hypothetical protein VF880_08635, partial [Actinomycetes bacterium]